MFWIWQLCALSSHDELIFDEGPRGHIRLRETCRVFWQQSGGAANGGFGMEGVWVIEDWSQGLWFLSCRFFLMNHRQMIWEWKKTCLFWSQHSFFFFEKFTQNPRSVLFIAHKHTQDVLKQLSRGVFSRRKRRYLSVSNHIKAIQWLSMIYNSMIVRFRIL